MRLRNGRRAIIRVAPIRGQLMGRAGYRVLFMVASRNGREVAPGPDIDARRKGRFVFHVCTFGKAALPFPWS